MLSATLLEKLEQLTPEMQNELEESIESILEKVKNENTAKIETTDSYRGFGSLKGKIWMSDDFDKPLDEFKEYI